MLHIIDIALVVEKGGNTGGDLYEIMEFLRHKGVRVRSGAILSDGNDKPIGRILLEDANDMPQALHVLAAAKVSVRPN
jgi:hypothetical protein